MPRELRNCEANTVEGLKRDLDRWLNSEVPVYSKMNGLWTAAAINKIEMLNKMWKNHNGGRSNYKKCIGLNSGPEKGSQSPTNLIM